MDHSSVALSSLAEIALDDIEHVRAALEDVKISMTALRDTAMAQHAVSCHVHDPKPPRPPLSRMWLDVACASTWRTTPLGLVSAGHAPSHDGPKRPA